MQFMGLEDTNAALAQTLRETAIAQQSLPLSATDAMGSMTQSMVRHFYKYMTEPCRWSNVGLCREIWRVLSLCAPCGSSVWQSPSWCSLRGTTSCMCSRLTQTATRWSHHQYHSAFSAVCSGSWREAGNKGRPCCEGGLNGCVLLCSGGFWAVREPAHHQWCAHKHLPQSPLLVYAIAMQGA